MLAIAAFGAFWVRNNMLVADIGPDPNALVIAVPGGFRGPLIRSRAYGVRSPPQRRGALPVRLRRRPAALDEVADSENDDDGDGSVEQKPGPPSVGCEQHINLPFGFEAHQGAANSYT